ncbi:MAG TPA: hypothetical protein ENH29_09390 [Bacteroidetes bacterium]|nr:hypothetical protein [Bacteroidota bacterium]
MTNSVSRTKTRLTVLVKFVFLFMAGLIFISTALAQETENNEVELQDKAIKVYLDVSPYSEDHIKREIAFVNYVRDRKQAQVYIMLTTQRTGSGGTENTIFFIGQKNLTGKNDTLKYVSQQSDTEEIMRDGIVKVLKAGLIQYVAKTPLFKDISISYKKKSEIEKVKDKWNYWVFNIGSNGFFNGQESSKSFSINSSLSADRITPDWKISLRLSTDYNENRYSFGDYSAKIVRRSHDFNSLIVKSLGSHWSAGFFGSVESSIYSNTKIGFNAAPALEYDLFPYSESTRREFRFLYRLGYANIHYEEETIFDKLNDHLFMESLSATFVVKEKWGSVTTSLRGSHYFHDFSKNHLGLNSNLNLRLFQGFSINLFGSVSLVNDQLGLRKSDYSTEDILLNRKELSTSYTYFAMIGLNYQFGSIFSNVVNPRFGSSGRGRTMIISN